MIYHSASVEETAALGEKLASHLVPGDLIAFSGDLGAGKTVFTGGIARGLGIEGYITSPTFTIVNEYLQGRMPLFHFDLYRLSSEEELFDIGWEDYLCRKGVCVVEWSENAPEAMENAIRVSIHCSAEKPEERDIIIDGVEL